jgi:hypothetical protein
MKDAISRYRKSRMKTKTIRLGTLVVFSLFCFTIALAQHWPTGPAALKTADGYLFVFNGTGQSFSLAIKGTDVKAVEGMENPAFIVDGKSLQIVLVVNQNFLNGVAVIGDDKLLLSHQKWESDYLMTEMFHKKFEIQSEPLNTNGRALLFWSYARPGFNDNYDRDCMLTTIVGSNLVGLNSALAPKDSLPDRRKFLLDVMATLKVSDKPFDIEKLSAEQTIGGK